ncbi:MAG: hypothetical protein CVU35_04950 [Betaproteobacteria bacterium HGW-Betaproteobacteria-8]|nr:MAG: hypothetical protein CVU35_04950 [Betaproteobacteria bacterium HGW-Betaproteobacteria-8]
MPTEYIIIYFVSLGVCSLSTIYKTVSFKNVLCRQIMGNMFWSLIPVVNTFKALLWILTTILVYFKKKGKTG